MNTDEKPIRYPAKPKSGYVRPKRTFGEWAGSTAWAVFATVGLLLVVAVYTVVANAPLHLGH